MELTLDEALRRGIEAHQAGKIQEADKFYTAILNADPRHADANHNMGILGASVGQAEQALPFFEAALAANPAIEQYWVSHILTLIGLERSDDAARALDQAREKGFQGEAFIDLARQISGLKHIDTDNMSGDPPEDQQQLVMDLHSQGEFQQTLDLAAQMLEKFPNSSVLFNIQGAAHVGFKRYDDAIDCFSKAIQIDPSYAAAHNNMGSAFAERGDLDRAVVSYSRAIEINPLLAQAHNNLGSARRATGDTRGAVESFRYAIEIDPSYAAPHNNLGRALHSMGKMNDAIRHFRKAIQIKPHDADAYNDMGLAQNEAGRVDDAMSSFLQALKIKPDYVAAYTNLGNAQKIIGDEEKAIATFHKALSINPKHAESYNSLGTSQKSCGDLKGATESYCQALNIKPDYADASYNMGIVLLELGRYQESLEFLERAIQLYPHDSQQLDKVQSFLLKNLYFFSDKQRFLECLDDLLRAGKCNAVIGSFCCRARLTCGLQRDNPFCNDPLRYVFETSLLETCDFHSIFVKPAYDILDDKRISRKNQGLLVNANQTSGNILANEDNFSKEVCKIIRLAIAKYKAAHKHSAEGFLVNWPDDYSLFGWLVGYKSGGSIRPHMHENGWLSGSVYINVPRSGRPDDGNLVVSLSDEIDSKGHKKVIDVATGSLCLFPASLHHYTIPFDSSEDRVVLAFDVIANSSAMQVISERRILS